MDERSTRRPAASYENDWIRLVRPTRPVELPLEFAFRELRNDEAADLAFLQRWGPLQLEVPPGVVPFVPSARLPDLNTIRAMRRSGELVLITRREEEDAGDARGVSLATDAPIPKQGVLIHRSEIERAQKVARALSLITEMLLGGERDGVRGAWVQSGCPNPGRSSVAFEWFAIALNAGLRHTQAHVVFTSGERVRMAAPAPTLYEAVCLQLFNALADDIAFRTCGHCGSPFVRQRGRAATSPITAMNYRTEGVQFCDVACKNAHTQRARRERLRQERGQSPVADTRADARSHHEQIRNAATGAGRERGVDFDAIADGVIKKVAGGEKRQRPAAPTTKGRRDGKR